ncbi:efflux RND transporter permease subunit [Alisedimentitalea sp. MJ-SS2]|uniref:efflux RND transporter permease subunit n=1 Tax=Aliisedimentitalea sp. MJ-SS2 TaxID=3049795 RepID=UPI00290E8F82|nr:efflux RND transporter permease subunit [Alisedimentitalea sp. MJ-SS2]MDU8925829.1 efflux RND transporter permease subunit [Alisedimentitalea sp. MJ-SS2]
MFGWFVRHPVAANLLMVGLCLLGLASISNIKRETFPDISKSIVSVTVAYPGASARDVAEEVCAPIEDALTGTTGLADMTCLAIDGVAQAAAELDEGGDEIQFYNDVFSSVSGINDFPTETETPMIKLQGNTELIAMLAVSGIDGKEGLIRYSDTLADRLQHLEGVTEARVSGITDRELRVSFDDLALRRYGLSGKDIVNAINARSLRLPLGAMLTDEQSLTLKYADTRRNKAELEDLIILQTASGGVVQLSDVASVNLVDLDENQESFINGKQAAIIYLFKTKEADAIRAYNRVEALLVEERAKFPEPFDLTITFNMTDLVNERLNLILKNTGIGLFLVFCTMWLFFTLRDALWIAAALPVSFLGTMFLMSTLGISINMITLVALLMAVGLIMDDSIVIAENIALWRKRAGQREAATKGLLEVIPGVTSSFLTTACVFGPLMFLAGDMGRVLQFIPMVLLLTLALSLVEGFLILPHHLSGGHGPDNPDNSHNRPAARAIEAFKEKIVIPLAGAFVKVRYLTVGSVIAALILSVGLVTSGQIKVVGFPAIEGDTVQVKLALSSGIARERTVETVDQLTSALDRVNAQLTPKTEGQEPLVKRVLVQYATNSDVNDNGSNTVTLTVDLLESSRRNIRADDVLAQWRAEAGPIPDLVQASFAQAELGPGGSDIDIRILGRDLAQVEAAGAEMLARLLARDDVTEAFLNFHGGRFEASLSLNAYGSAIGLTPQSLADQLRQAFSGSETDNFRSGLSTVTVRVELDNAVDSLTKLEQFPISVGNGKLTELATVADIELTTSYPAINRRNGQTEANIIGQIDRDAVTATAIATFAVDEVGPELETLYSGISIDIGGASEDQAKSTASMQSKLLLGLAGVYLILAFQFRSYTLPLVVMLSIPFALIGTIMGHWAMGIDLAMPSFIGFASLAGIVVNNAILFLTFFQTHLKDEDHVSAALDAVRDRFRPILLSTGTTVVGLIPLMADGSPQVQIMVPLVLSVAAGLTASMILVVLVLPSLLTIYFDVFSVRNWIDKFDVIGTRHDEATPRGNATRT